LNTPRIPAGHATNKENYQQRTCIYYLTVKYTGVSSIQSICHLEYKLLENRNTFCGTWYLSQNQVHNERTVPIIMLDALSMHKTAVIPLLMLNLTSQSCSLTQISY